MDLSLPSSAGDGERAYLTGLRPSRIRAVQAARNGWTSVDLIDVDSGQAVALRGMLELFGVHVRRFAIGQARQLVRALGGEAGAPYVVVVCHGDDGCGAARARRRARALPTAARLGRPRRAARLRAAGAGRGGGEDPAGRLEAVELRHADVHEHDRRVEPPDLGDRLAAGARLGDDLDVGL